MLYSEIFTLTAALRLVCPTVDLPSRECAFIIDPKGKWLVSMLGLENEMAIRVHMCSKGKASAEDMFLHNVTGPE